MRRYFKRGFSLFVVLVVLISLMPVGVLAEEVNNENHTNISNVQAELPTLKAEDLKTGKIETIKEEVTADRYLNKEVKVPLIQEGTICVEDTIETDQLDSDLEKEIKDKIFKALTNTDKDLNLSDYQMKWAQSAEISAWFLEQINDNPSFFYVGDIIRFTGKNDVLTGVSFNYNLEVNEVNEYENAIQDILSNVKDEMTTPEKLLVVHDAFCRKVEYDYDNYYKGTIPQEDYTAYGALVNGKAVCMGYSLAFADIVKRLGIDVKCVIGFNHMWNLVEVDGSWYHIDTTWDDPNSHAYFLISDEQIKLIGGDAHWGWDSSYPKADNPKYENYFLFQFWSNLYYEAGKWIYIKDYKIHSSKFDGSEDSVIVDAGFSEPISFLTKWKNKLYYFKGNNYDNYGPVDRIKIFSCNFDGSDVLLFCPVPLQNSEYINYYENANNNSTILFKIANGDTSQITDYQIDLNSQVAIDSNVTYRTHVQNVGWQGYSYGGGMSGTSGKGLRLEGIKININESGYAVGVKYSTHVQNIGWQDFVKDGAMSGTEGKSLRLEAIKINLTGADADKYDIYYQVHAQNFGWLDWAKDGESAGTEGFGYRLEAIKIVVAPKGSAAPGLTVKPFVKK